MTDILTNEQHLKARAFLSDKEIRERLGRGDRVIRAYDILFPDEHAAIYSTIGADGQIRVEPLGAKPNLAFHDRWKALEAIDADIEARITKIRLWSRIAVRAAVVLTLSAGVAYGVHRELNRA